MLLNEYRQYENNPPYWVTEQRGQRALELRQQVEVPTGLLDDIQNGWLPAQAADIFVALAQGFSPMLIGAPGTGKSHALRNLKPYINELLPGDGAVAWTAATHAAVQVIEGDATVHSFLQVQLFSDPVRSYIEHALPAVKKKLTQLQLHVISEACMFTGQFFEKVDEYLAGVRPRSSAPPQRLILDPSFTTLFLTLA